MRIKTRAAAKKPIWISAIVFNNSMACFLDQIKELVKRVASAEILGGLYIVTVPIRVKYLCELLLNSLLCNPSFEVEA